MGQTNLGNLGQNPAAAAPVVTSDGFIFDYNGALVHTKASILAAANAPAGSKVHHVEIEAASDTGTPPTLQIRTQNAVPILPGGTESVTGQINEECDDFTFTSFAGCTGRIRGIYLKTGAINN
jgi:hypothetical protein